MSPRNKEAGLTLLELLVVVAIIGMSVSVAAFNLEPLESPLQSATTLTESFARQARLNAIATTSAYRIIPFSSSRLAAQTASSCAATTWTTDPDMRLDLPTGVTFESTDWSACFSSRGISSTNVTATLQHDTYGSADVEVLVGGTTRVIR